MNKLTESSTSTAQLLLLQVTAHITLLNDNDLRRLADLISTQQSLRQTRQKVDAIKEAVEQHGFCMQELYHDDIDGLKRIELQVKCRGSSYDKYDKSGVTVDGVFDSSDQAAWYSELEYVYPIKCRASDDYDDGPYDWLSGDWDDADSCTLDRNVSLYCSPAPHRCFLTGTVFRAFNDDQTNVETWRVGAAHLYCDDKRKDRNKHKEWKLHEWTILDVTPPSSEQDD